MCLPVAGAVLQRRWPRGRDMKPSPCPPWHWRHLRVLAPSLGAVRGPCPWPELSDTGGAGTCMAKAPCPSSLLVLGPRGGRARGRAAAAWFFGGSFPAPTAAGWPHGFSSRLGELGQGTLGQHLQQGLMAQRGLRSLGEPPPRVSHPRTERGEPLGQFAAGLGQSWAQAAGAGADPGPSVLLWGKAPGRAGGAPVGVPVGLGSPLNISTRACPAPGSTHPSACMRAAWRLPAACSLGLEDEIKH